MILFGIKFRFCNLYSYESILMSRHRKFLFSKWELLLSINPLFLHNQEMHSFDVCMTRSLKFTFSYKIFIDLKSILYTGAKPSASFFQKFFKISKTKTHLKHLPLVAERCLYDAILPRGEAHILK